MPVIVRRSEAVPTEHRTRKRTLRDPLLARLAMNQMTTFRWSLEDDLSGYQDGQVGAIGIWRPKLCEYGEEQAVERIRESGLDVSSVGWIGGFTGANGHSYQESIDDARDTIITASVLKAGCVTVVSGSQGFHIRSHARRLLVDALKELGEFAGECEVDLALQPMHPLFERDWSFLNNVEEALELIDRVRMPSVKLAFGTYHLWQQPRLNELIPQIAPLISVVQLSDWREPPRCDNDRCLPGDGHIPLDEIVANLEQSGYGGWYEIEVWSSELWSSDYPELVDTCRNRFIDLFPTSSDA